jgi:molybdopterin molybdotransferase
LARPTLTCISAGEARRRLEGWIEPTAVELVPRQAAGGRVLAAEVRATAPVPAFPRAAMDGFAVRAADVAAATPGAPVLLRLGGRVAMGEPPGSPVAAGEALAISTGAHLPPGADAVVMLEDTVSEVGSVVRVLRAIDPGRHVVPVGEEFLAGSVAVEAGRRIGGREMAALAAFGVARVPVHLRARVAILSSGSELCGPDDQAPPAGKIRDINQPALAAAVEALDAAVTRAGVFPEEPEALAQAVARLLPDHDMVLLTGGSSVGVRDFTAEVVARLRAELLFHGLEVRPGRPTLAARLANRPIFGLPGVPAAALTIFQVFVQPVLRVLQGEAAARAGGRSKARLEAPQASRQGREDYLHVRLVDRQGETWAQVLPGPTALSSFVRSDGLAIIPAEVEGLAAGALVDVLAS